MEVLEIIVTNNYVGFEEIFVIWRCCKALRPYFVGTSVRFDSCWMKTWGTMLRLPSLDFCEKVERALQFKERLQCCPVFIGPFEQLVFLLASEDCTEEVLYMLRDANCSAYFLANIARMHGGLSFASQLKALTTSSSDFNSEIADGPTISFVTTELYWSKQYWNWLTERRDFHDLFTDRLWRFFASCIAGRCKLSLAYLGTHLAMSVHFSAEQYRYVTTTYFDFIAHFCSVYPGEFVKVCKRATQWRYPRALELLEQISVKNGTVMAWT